MNHIIKKCLLCQANFEAEVRYIKRGHAKFCSLSCSAQHNSKKLKKEPNVQCAYCKSFFYKRKSKMKNSKSGLFFCCREHKDLAQRIGGIKEIQPHHYKSGKFIKYRKVAFENYPHKCNRCDYSKYKQVLQVHHIDENRDNNSIDNLEILCPNCHWEQHFVLAVQRDNTHLN